ncbi:hypothetical protein PS1_019312 [Malus domestica]
MKLRCRRSFAGELIIPDGHILVYVDDEMEWFVVSAELLNHPVFVGLLDKSEQGYDYYISLMDTVFSDDVGPTALAAARGGCPSTFRGCGESYGGTSASSRMAYIPTHKPHSKESESTLLTSEP